jgi:hypothetical protein
VFVGDIENFVDDRKTCFYIFNRRVARWHHMYAIEVCEWPEVALFAGHD